MGKYLDLEDVAAGNPVAEQELKELRQRAQRAEEEIEEGQKTLNQWVENYSRIEADNWPDRFYEAVGWTLAECCAALDRGEDPRQMEAPALLDLCKRDLSRDATPPPKSEPVAQECEPMSWNDPNLPLRHTAKKIRNDNGDLVAIKRKQYQPANATLQPEGEPTTQSGVRSIADIRATGAAWVTEAEITMLCLLAEEAVAPAPQTPEQTGDALDQVPDAAVDEAVKAYMDFIGSKPDWSAMMIALNTVRRHLTASGVPYVPENIRRLPEKIEGKRLTHLQDEVAEGLVKKALASAPAVSESDGEGCPECGSTDTFWWLVTENNGGAVDGRIRLSDITPLLVQSCGACSETIQKVSSDEIGRTQIAAPQRGGE